MAAPPRAYVKTTVSADQSKAEIRALLLRYGAEQFGIMEEPGRAAIGFVAHGRMVRLEVPLPDRRYNATTPAGKLLRAGTAAAHSAHDQEERRIWRAVRAWIKSQLEAVEAGIKTREEIWLVDTVLPDGQRFADWAAPQVAREVEAGRMPACISPALAVRTRED